MQFSLTIDETGRLVCDLAEDDQHATVTASNVPAAAEDLLAAAEDARKGGLGESVWSEPGGDYLWMLRREGQQLTVAVMWSRGTVPGWQHVFRAECNFAWFAASVQQAVDRLRVAG